MLLLGALSTVPEATGPEGSETATAEEEEVKTGRGAGRIVSRPVSAAVGAGARVKPGAVAV